MHEQERRPVTADDRVLTDSIGSDEPVFEDMVNPAGRFGASATEPTGPPFAADAVDDALASNDALVAAATPAINPRRESPGSAPSVRMSCPPRESADSVGEVGMRVPFVTPIGHDRMLDRPGGAVLEYVLRPDSPGNRLSRASAQWCEGGAEFGGEEGLFPGGEVAAPGGFVEVGQRGRPPRPSSAGPEISPGNVVNPTGRGAGGVSRVSPPTGSPSTNAREIL